MNDKASKFFDGLQVPVNPNYDFEGDPSEQPDYANPVVLANKLVQYANGVLEAGKHVVILARRRERVRLELKAAERELVAMRRDTLSRNPAPPSAAKNLALTDAYVYKCIEADGNADKWKALEARIAKLQDEIEGLEKEEENLKYMQHTIRIASENITNKLSFTKHEAKMNFGA